MDNYQKTIISQWATSPTLTQLIDNFNQYIDPTYNMNTFYDLVWNVDTAVGYGLAIWGRIVGVTNVVQIPVTPGFFGFYEALQYGAVGFGQGPFWNGTAPLTQSYNLPDDDFRTLILAKALANIGNCSAPAINQILLNLFPGRGNCYVTDNLDMTMTYTFNFTLTPIELAIITQTGALPKPAGVYAGIVQA